MKIVVMGGSFNPPTLAHQKLMLAAVDQVRADLGIYVPSSYDYVRRKLSRAKHPEETMDEQLRLQMLQKMAEEDLRLTVDDCEYRRTGRGYTYETLEFLQEKYPEAEIFFLAGGDKLDIIPRWHRIKDFLERFHIIVTNREDYDAEAELAANPFLNTYRERFMILPCPAGIDGISSSAVREKLRTEDYEGAKEMLHPEAYEIMMDPRNRSEINTFRGRYSFLSNFYEAPVTYRDLTYGNAEAAFQAQKCRTEEERLPFTEYNPPRAKSAGRRVNLRPDWEEVKVGLMEEIVRAKFSQNEELKFLLLGTGDALLVEGNTWNDTFWGVNLKTGRGENHLGILLMKIRDELRVSEDTMNP